MIASSFFFALMAVFIRYTKDLPTFEQVVFRNFVISILMFLLIVKEKRIDEMKVKDGKKEIFFRSLFGFIGMVSNFYAVKYLNIADSSAIGKLSPFFVMIFAALLLGEKLERHSIIAIVLSILGMLLVVKPKFDGSMIPSLVAVAGAVKCRTCNGYAFSGRQEGKRRSNNSLLRNIFDISLHSVLSWKLCNSKWN